MDFQAVLAAEHRPSPFDTAEWNRYARESRTEFHMGERGGPLVTRMTPVGRHSGRQDEAAPPPPDLRIDEEEEWGASQPLNTLSSSDVADFFNENVSRKDDRFLC